MRRFGWLPETVPPPCDKLWSIRGQPALPDTTQVVDGQALAGAILDQGNTSSCVAHALAQAMRISIARYEGNMHLRSAVLPSRLWIYRLARETHGAGDRDDGTYISAAISACQRLGWPSEGHVSWSERDVNRGMTITDRHHAYDQAQSIREHAIVSEGAEKVAQTKHAVSDGYPIVFGTDVDAQFVSCDDYTPQQLTGAPVGGHAMVMIGYDPDGVIVVNSWGIGWGMGGLGRISWDGFSKRARDLRVIRMVRRATS